MRQAAGPMFGRLSFLGSHRLSCGVQWGAADRGEHREAARAIAQVL